MTEHDLAREWARQRGLSAAQLAELSGYSREAIYCFWRGKTANRQPIKKWAWQRFKMACAGIDAQVRSGVNFDWEA